MFRKRESSDYREREIVNLPNGQISLKNSYFFLGFVYFLGQSLWFFTLGLGLLDWYLGLVIAILWGFQIRKFRLHFQKYPVIGLRNGQWFLMETSPMPGKEIQVCLDFDSVILPGMLLLSFRDELNRTYRFLITPECVSGRERFSWLSRYAKLSPVFQRFDQDL
jgi:hypothetical protein